MKNELNVQSIFPAIDGEENAFQGAGQLTTFIRLKGCNARCRYCIGEKPARRRPRIITSNCSNKRISMVQVGDKLLAFDESFNLVETEVKEVFSHEVVEHYEIKIEGKPLLYTTLDHPFYTTLGWKEAKDLIPGDILYHIDFRDKISYMKRGDKNPMKNPVVARRSAENTDYGQIGIKVSAAWKDGRMHSHPQTAANKIATSKRMIIDNPMKDPKVAKRVASTLHRRYLDGTLIPPPHLKSDEFREVASIRMKADNPMKDPEISRRNAESHFKTISGLELKYKELFEIATLSIEYVGNNKLAIGSREDRYRFPDFVVSGKKKVIEIYDTTFEYAVDGGRKFRDSGWEEERREHFLKFGYGVLFLTEKDIKNKGWEQKVHKFLSNGLKVLKVRKIVRKPLKVYNFRCEPYSNYFVDYISVHNCDTKYSQNSEPENWMTIDEVIQQIHFPKVTITGGEPLLQKEAVEELCSRLQHHHRSFNGRPYTISVETNGTIVPTYFHPDVRYIVDFKLMSSGVMDKMNALAFSSLQSCDVIKFVISDMEDYKYAKMLIAEHPNWEARKVFSPAVDIKEVAEIILSAAFNAWPIENVVDTVWPRQLAEMMIRDRVDAQYSLQIHKVLWPGVKEER